MLSVNTEHTTSPRLNTPMIEVRLWGGRNDLWTLSARTWTNCV